MHRLLRFAEGARAPGGGFGNLDDDGRLQTEQPMQTWVSTRMTYCFALGSLLGRDGDAERVDHGLAALLPGGALRDNVNGGWYSSVRLEAGATGAATHVVDDTKAAYAHAFVVLAAAAALVAGRPDADRLLADALAVIERYFWDDAAGMMRESFSADWASEEAYRGANANMHSVEAFLAAADALGEGGAIWRQRAGRILERIVHRIAREADWRLPEHFDTDYVAVPDYNTDNRAHPFRPYGVTPGHLFEWARLALHLLAAEDAAGSPAREWLLPDAVALYRTARRDRLGGGRPRRLRLHHRLRRGADHPGPHALGGHGGAGGSGGASPRPRAASPQLDRRRAGALDDDRRILAFVDEFERRFVGQGEQRRSIEETSTSHGRCSTLPRG